MMASGLDTTTANTTEYCAILGNITFVTSEVQVRIPFREAGVISNLAIIVDANNINATSTLRLRIGGANGNQIINVSANAVGFMEDTTNTDAIAAGNTINIMFTPGAATGTMTLVQISFVFTPTNTAITHSRFAATTTITNNISENCYYSLSGQLQTTIDSTGELASILVTPKAAGTFKHTAVYSSSAGDRSVGIRYVKNSTDDAINRAFLAGGVTGLDEDTSGTSSVNGSTDTFNFLVGYGGGTTTRTVNFAAISFENTGNYFLMVNGHSPGVSETFGVTRYYHLGGKILGNTNESSVRQRARIPIKFSNMAIRVSSNTLNGDVTFTFRKNGANGNQTRIITAGQTGLFEDTTNNDIVDVNDEINIRSTNSATSGSIIYTVISMLAEYQSIVTTSVTAKTIVTKQIVQKT